MQVVKLRRGASTDEGTFGVLSFGQSIVHSLELPWRGNLRRRSSIPEGVYTCALVNSPRFGRVYHVQDVPDRSHVLIHPANLAGAVPMGWVSQLEGCIAPCERLGRMRIPDGRLQAAGLVSRSAVESLMAWAGGKPFKLEIESC